MEKKLRVKYSDFKTNLTYNEWVKEYKFGRDYVPPTPYYQGNTQWNASTFQSIEDMFPRISFGRKLINKLKKQSKWLERTN
jgi:hypothetical protein